MSEAILNLNCPYCGGSLTPPVGSRKITCDFCSKRLYFSGDFIPRFILEEAKNNQIREKTEILLGEKVVKPSLKQEAIVVSKRGRYIPFYLIMGKKGGVVGTQNEKTTYKIFRASPYEDNIKLNDLDFVKDEESRVIISDFRYIYPAVLIEEADSALDELREIIYENIEKIVGTTLYDISREKEVIFPSIDFETIVEKGVLSAKGGKDELEILELKKAIIYYPVEELTFKFGENYFSLTYDLFKNRFIWGTMPCNRKPMVLLSLILSSLLGFFLGQLIRFILIPVGEIKLSQLLGFYAYFGTILFLLLSLIFGGGLKIAFDLLKTPFVAKVLPNGVVISRLKEPPKSILDSYLGFIQKVINNIIEQATKGK